MELTRQKELITRYITEVWDEGNTNNLSMYLHPNFKDFSLPEELSPDANGLKEWVDLTHQSLQPQTIIEEHLAEPDRCIIRISMHLKHVGLWRGIPATGITATTHGYRSFLLKDGLILEHRALIDGNTLERQLSSTTITGCKAKPAGN
ncbi:ester cyclase [Chitinophaga flava]|uniref:Ester cyclase n=1 Tax=Chitinophaga flava TaxID=2259036 RepID=A0A365Y3B5_9BACT|nr:ester cyclase [Chitinophaga flava]RBL93073.1 hypothetical protein DF182_11020 [Chitinophaga flava]